jgi:hypothetical protein
MIPNDYRTTYAMARDLSVSRARLWWWRVTPWGDSPPWTRVDGHVVYHKATTETWLDAHKVPATRPLWDDGL